MQVFPAPRRLADAISETALSDRNGRIRFFSWDAPADVGGRRESTRPLSPPRGRRGRLPPSRPTHAACVITARYGRRQRRRYWARNNSTSAHKPLAAARPQRPGPRRYGRDYRALKDRSFVTKALPGALWRRKWIPPSSIAFESVRESDTPETPQSFTSSRPIRRGSSSSRRRRRRKATAREIPHPAASIVTEISAQGGSADRSQEGAVAALTDTPPPVVLP